MSMDLTDVQSRVLVAVVEGFRAREGMKDRIRALNEWEIARRAGFTDASFASYLEHPMRDTIMGALGALQGLGLVSVWDRGVKYDSFVPTAAGTNALAIDDAVGEAVPAVADSIQAVSEIAGGQDDPVLQRLDEMIRLLRSVDSRLERLQRGE